MTMLKSPDNFDIVHRGIAAQPDSIYPSDSRLAGCVALAINYSQSLLQLGRVQHALGSYAQEYTQSEPNAWYKNPVYGYKSPRHLVSDFINTVMADFFLTCIDSTITNPDCLGATANREWHGRFSPRDHCILLNASRVGDMVAAATRASYSNDRHDYDNREYRTFLFIFANTFFYETCHLFTTFLTKGRKATPPHVAPQVEVYSNTNKGEFGRYMETVVYGGTLEYYRDPTRGVGQSGIPHIITPEGARRVNQHTIDAIVNKRNIGTDYPIILGTQFVDTRTMQTLGVHHPPAVISDPMNWKFMQQLKNRNHNDHVGTQSDLYGPSSHSGYSSHGAGAGMPGGSGGRGY